MLLMAAEAVDAADFDAGMEANNRGDYATALREFRPLAEQGDAGAQNALGFMYYSGWGVPEDNQQAVSWYRKAAEQGNAQAQARLGFMYDNGKGVPEDDRHAVSWYRKAAEQGNDYAQIRLGFMYDNGEGVPEDDRHAVSWYRKAAEQGNAYAQDNLGFMYDNGKGVPEDDRQAVSWYRKAAEQGNAYAQASLGFMYDNGEGVPEDDRQAVSWYRKAAEQGNAYAQARLGFMYDNGEGVPEDYVQAYAWWNLAAAQHESEPDGNGSGFLVGRDGEIVTNHHVIDNCAKVTVNHTGRSYDAAIRATDAANDLALLKVSQTFNKAATFSQSPRASLGESVTVAGYPLHGILSKEINVTSGNVSALAGLGDDTKQLQITAPVQPGNSGGPLLDGSGNVIGVVVSKLDAVHTAELTGDIPQNINFAIKGALVRGFLDIHGVEYRRRASNTKLASEQLAELARGFTVAVYCWK